MVFILYFVLYCVLCCFGVINDDDEYVAVASRLLHSETERRRPKVNSEYIIGVLYNLCGL